MLRASIFVIAFALCATGLIAQDDLAQYQEHMKAAAAANMAMRKGIAENDSAAVSTNAANMATQFDWIGTFFQGKGKQDGVTFAKNAGEAVKAVGDAKTPDDQKAAVAKLGPACNACHMVYRQGSAFKGL